jgi:hypothetical protein
MNNFFSDIKIKLDSIAAIQEDSDTVTGEDVIRVNVPAFLRIIELVREDIKDDVPLHYLTEILTRLSKTGVITMEDYETIENYTMQDADQESGEESVYESVALTEEQFDESAGEKDACYHKVKSRYKVWPSAYASGALVQCRKVGAKNWGNKSKK